MRTIVSKELNIPLCETIFHVTGVRCLTIAYSLVDLNPMEITVLRTEEVVRSDGYVTLLKYLARTLCIYCVDIKNIWAMNRNHIYLLYPCLQYLDLIYKNKTYFLSVTDNWY